MAECRITCFNSNNNNNNNNIDEHNGDIPEGKVQKVCKEWLVREDGVLAHQLQSQEINEHYEGNRCKNRTVREDLPLARHMQRSEEDEANEMRITYERILEEQLEKDERVAREIQQSILEQEYGQRQTEEEDERLAKKMAKREKTRLIRKRLEREKQEVEKLSKRFNTTLNCNNQMDNCDKEDELSCEIGVNTAVAVEENPSQRQSDDDLDLSEFCLQPPPGLTPEELRIFLEEQDAEIARLLQQQEMKRKSAVNKEKLAVIEAQDYEIARLIHKQEKDRIRRLKEKAKQKAVQRQLGSESNDGTNAFRLDDRPNQRYNDTNDLNHIYAEHQSRAPTQASNYYSDVESITYEEPYQLLHHNIAMDLDPTYQRNSTALSNPLINSRSTNLGSNNPLESNDEICPDFNPNANTAGIHFAQVYQVSSSESSSPVSTTDRIRESAVDDIQDVDHSCLLSPVMPYLPVQGQRRISSIEKRKKSRDKCKTQ